MKQKYNFGNKIIKQGNSHCVRIPKLVMDELKLEEGLWVAITLTRTDDLYELNFIISPDDTKTMNYISTYDMYC